MMDSTMISTMDSTLDSTVDSTMDSTLDSTVDSTMDSTLDSTVGIFFSLSVCFGSQRKMKWSVCSCFGSCLFFILRLPVSTGQSHVIGSPQPIVALAGDDVVLLCRLEPAVSDFSGAVEWTKEGLSPPFVHVHKSGCQVVQSQNPLYKYRTVLFVDELKNGNVSLKLFRATVSDEGTYLCFIPSIRKGDFIQLTVGQSHVIGSPQPIVALAGDDVVLPCRLEPAISDFSGTVEWTKEGLNPPFVHVHESSGQVVQSQNPLYKYRTVLFVDELKNGNVSLKLFGVTVSDEGTYLCFIPSIRKGDFIQLTVGAASSPVINVTKSISGVTLECESKGWYPEPELLWLDAEGELLSAGAPETVRGPHGLYTVSSRVTVERNRSDTFTCRVQQLSINQSRDALIHVPDDFFMCTSAAVGICSAVCITTGFAVGLCVLFAFMCRRRICDISFKFTHLLIFESKQDHSVVLV
ncbi:butyrophilin subfamily 2 member A2-like [Myripristis murdjan]|uniref:butyrophilin subfamily 2 member A2-like n=1 Tax=Myripristis murdjan TaxID=586833 RepID=UPI001175D968|nr:butyrophilin subfamily 2 member A2-like [Myripristis murdjan]